MPTMRRLAGIDMLSDRNSGETTIVEFRDLVEKLLNTVVCPIR